MYTGVRLSTLAVGEPLLSASWIYKDKTGIEAVEERLEDQFYQASYLGFKYIIDTIRPQINASNRLTLANNGINGDIWSFEDRMALYRKLSLKTGIIVVFEIEFTVEVTNTNVDEWVRFILQDLIYTYSWATYWNIGVNPDATYANGHYNCSPLFYSYIMDQVYRRAKGYNHDIKIGGPNIESSLIQFLNNRTGWLNEAVGNEYSAGNEYESIGYNGFLDNIDFFTFHNSSSSSININNYASVIGNIRTILYEHLGNNQIAIFATNIGHKAAFDDSLACNQQAYYDLRDMLTAVKNGIIPFKNELVDAFPESYAWAGNFDPNRTDYGILRWFMNTKLSYSTYKFIYDALDGYSMVVANNNVYEENDEVDSISLQKIENNIITTVTIIWPISYSTATVLLLPAAYYREYQVENGARTLLNSTTEINLKNTHFIIVYEKTEQLIINEDDIRLNIERKLRYQSEITEQVLSYLPTSYNTEIMDTNIYRLIRAFAIELADASMALTMSKEDLYLETAREDALYNNFGALIKLSKRSDWSHEKYRLLIKGLMSSLLKGPTVKSVASALALFTNFNVNIAELYKAEVQERYANIAADLNPQFSFIIEIEKPVEEKNYSQDELIEDTTYVLQLVKPAHTLGIIAIILVSTEDWQASYKQRYDKIWNDADGGDNLTADFSKALAEGQFGWKHFDYPGNFQISPILSNAPLTNGGSLIGPRYVLLDESLIQNDTSFDEYIANVDIGEDLINFLGTDVKEEYDQYKETYNYQEELFEPRFGFYHDKYFQLSGPHPSKVLNHYLLAGTNSHLKDEEEHKIEVFNYEKYVFNNILKAFQFTSKTFGYTFSMTNNNILTEWGNYLKEHSFKEKIISLSNGSTHTIERISEIYEQVLDGYYDWYKHVNENNETALEGFSETIVPDDPLGSFRLNHLLDHHKLGPNQREKVSFTTFIQDIYNSAHDYLSRVFHFEVHDKYENEIDDQRTELAYFFTNDDTFDRLKDNFLKLNLPKDLLYLENDINNALIIHDNDFSEYYGNEYLGIDELKDILQQIAQKYNRVIDFNSPELEYWVSSVKGSLRTPSNQLGLLRPFISRSIEKCTLGIYLSSTYDNIINDSFQIFNHYKYTDYYYINIEDNEHDKNVDFSEKINVIDNINLPLRFSHLESYTKNLLNPTPFCFNSIEKSIITEKKVEGFIDYINEIDDYVLAHLKANSKDIVDLPLEEEEQSRAIGEHEIYSFNSDNSSLLKFNLPFFNLSHFPAYNISQYDIDTDAKDHVEQLADDLPTYGAYSNDQYEDIQEQDEKLSTEFDESNFRHEFGVIRLNHRIFGISKFIKNYQSHNIFDSDRKETYKKTIYEETLGILNNQVIDQYNNSIEETVLSPMYDMGEKYEIYHNVKPYKFNQGKVDYWPIEFSAFASKPEEVTFTPSWFKEVYDTSNEFNYDIINSYVEEKFNDVNDTSILDLIHTEYYHIIDEDKDHIQLNRTNGTFMPFLNNKINLLVENVEKRYRLQNESLEFTIDESKYQDNYQFKNEISTISRDFEDIYILYDDENNEYVTRLNGKYKKFIKYRTAVYHFNPEYGEQYTKIIHDHAQYINDTDKSEQYKIKKELGECHTYFDDTFYLYDDEKDALKLGKDGKFIKYRAFRYDLDLINTDYYHPVYESFTNIMSSLNNEYYPDVKEINNFNISGLYEHFVLDENNYVFNKHNGKLASKSITKLNWCPDVIDFYKKEINEQLSVNNDNLINEQYKDINEYYSSGTFFYEQYSMKDDETEDLDDDYIKFGIPNYVHANSIDKRLVYGKFLNKRIAIHSWTQDVIDYYKFDVHESALFTSRQYSYEQYHQIQEKDDLQSDLRESFNIYDNEKDALKLGKNGRFIKNKATLITMNPEANDTYDKDVNEFTQFKSSYLNYDIFNNVNEIHSISNDFEEKFIIYDDSQALQLNHNHGHFLGRRTDIITFTTYAQDKVSKAYEQLFINLSNKSVDIYDLRVSESLALETNFNEEFILYDSDNALRLNKNHGKFLKCFTNIITFNTYAKDHYHRPLYDNNVISINSFCDDKFNQVHDIYSQKLDLNEHFTLYDSETSLVLNKQNGKFLSKSTAIVSFHTYFEEQATDILEQSILHIKKIFKDIYTRPITDDIIAHSVWLSDKFIIDNNDGLQLNIYNGKFISHLNELFTFRYDFIESTFYKPIELQSTFNLERNQNNNEEYIPINDEMLEHIVMCKDVYIMDNDYIQLNNSGHRFIGIPTDIYSLETNADEIYDNLIKESSLLTLKQSYYDKYYIKSDYSYLTFSLNEHYHIIDEDRDTIRLNSNNGVFLGHRSQVYSITTDLHELYNNHICELSEFSPSTVDEDFYTTKKDDLEFIAHANELYQVKFDLPELTGYSSDIYNLQVNEFLKKHIFTDYIDKTKDIKELNNTNISKDIMDIYDIANENYVNAIIYYNDHKQFGTDKLLGSIYNQNSYEHYSLQDISCSQHIYKKDIIPKNWIDDLYFNLLRLYTDNYDNSKELNNHVAYKGLYKELFKPVQDKITHIGTVNNEEYFNLNDPTNRLKFTGMRLNMSRFMGSANEIFTVNNAYEDIVQKQKEDYEERSIKYIEKFNAPRLKLSEIRAEVFTEDVLKETTPIPFVFTGSQFNKQKFIRVDISDNLIMSLTHTEQFQLIYEKLLEQNIVLQDTILRNINDISNKEIKSFNYERYIHYIDEFKSIDIKASQKELYEVNKVVAYVQLEKLLNNKLVVVKRETLV